MLTKWIYTFPLYINWQSHDLWYYFTVDPDIEPNWSLWETHNLGIFGGYRRRFFLQSDLADWLRSKQYHIDWNNMRKQSWFNATLHLTESGAMEYRLKFL